MSSIKRNKNKITMDNNKLTKSKRKNHLGGQFEYYNFSSEERDVLDKILPGKKTFNIDDITSINNQLLREYNNINSNNKESNLFYYKPVVNYLFEDSFYSVDYSPKLSIYENILECIIDRDDFNENYQDSHEISNSLNKFLKNPYILIPEKNICYPYNSTQVQNILISNLRKSYFDPEKIICPQQISKNCWFNTGLVIYFFSDQGKKFNKYLRYCMIKGYIENKIIEEEDFKRTLFIFNLYIDACIQGELFCTWMDTNYLIHQIFIQSAMKGSLTFDKDQIGNPYYFYNTLIKTLNLKSLAPKMLSIELNQFDNFNDLILYVEDIFKNYQIEILRIIIFPQNISLNTCLQKNDIFSEFLNIRSQDKNFIKKKFNDKLKKITFKNKNNQIVFNLDSVLLRSVDESHFCCGVTMNTNPYIYDGFSYSKLTNFVIKNKYSWPDLINKDIYWYFDSDIKQVDAENFDNFRVFFNFIWGYQELYYYRIN